MNNAADDPEGQLRVTAFAQGIREFGLGEVSPEHFHIEYRWAGGNADRIRRYAAELVGFADVIVATGSFGLGPLQQATRSVPIVFVAVFDPVGAGFVPSLAQPSGNITGFTSYEYSLGVKWLELLKQIAPGVTRAAVLRDPAIPSGIGRFGALLGVAQSLGVELTPVDGTSRR